MHKLVLFLLSAWAIVIPATAYTPDKDPGSSQISPSVVLMTEADWMLSHGPDGLPSSRCLDMVARAREYSSGNRLSFVPIFHWLPGPDGLGVDSYCYLESQASDNGSGDACKPWTPDKVAEFKESMTLCFMEAFHLDFVVYVRPQLQDGLNKGIWPNGLLFSPHETYGGCYSYADIVTFLLAYAMRDAITHAADRGILYIPPETTRPVVYMSVQGDMSATLLRFTHDWMDLVPLIKNIIGDEIADVKVGAGLTYNALNAVEGVNTSTGSVFGSFRGGISGVKEPSTAPTIQTANMKDLLSNQLDFLGVSAFAPFSGADFAPSEFFSSASQVAGALSKLVPSLNVAQLLASGKLELHYSEWGLGGGFKPANGPEQLAPSADACAQQPWTGITGGYVKSVDPWAQGYLSSFRASYFKKALQWVSSPDISTSSYPVQQIFVWSMDSWDVFGIYPTSSSVEGTFRDLTISRKIAAHNTAVIAAQMCKFKNAEECESFIAKNVACLKDFSGTACLARGAVVHTEPPTEAVGASGVGQPPAGSAERSPAGSCPTPEAAPSSSRADASSQTGVQGAAAANCSTTLGAGEHVSVLVTKPKLDNAPGAVAASRTAAAALVGGSKNSASMRLPGWLLAAALCLVLLLI